MFLTCLTDRSNSSANGSKRIPSNNRLFTRRLLRSDFIQELISVSSCSMLKLSIKRYLQLRRSIKLYIAPISAYLCAQIVPYRFHTKDKPYYQRPLCILINLFYFSCFLPHVKASRQYTDPPKEKEYNMKSLMANHQGMSIFSPT